MSDFLISQCEGSNDPLFLTYTEPGCDAIQGKIVKVALFANKTDFQELCPQVAGDFDDLIADNRALIVPVIAELPQGQNEELTDPFPCGGGISVLHTDKTFTARAKFWKDKTTGVDNYPFWQRLKEQHVIGGFSMLADGGLVLTPESINGYSFDAQWSNTDGILQIEFTVRYRTRKLEKPYHALTSVWGC